MKKFFVVVLVCFNIALGFAIAMGSSAKIQPIKNAVAKTQQNQIVAPNTVNASSATMKRILSTYGKDIKNAAQTYNVSSRALTAIMYVESGGDPKAKGDAGEKGCMQILPSTAKMIGVKGDLFDCRFSIFAAAKYLSQLQKEPHLDRTYKVVAAYNAGSRGVPKLSDNDYIQTEYLAKIHQAAQKIPEHW